MPYTELTVKGDVIPRPVRRALYLITVVLQLALVCGVLKPLGAEWSDYAEDVIQFLAALSALATGGTALAHSRPPQALPGIVEEDRGAINAMTVLIFLGIAVLVVILIKLVDVNVR